MYRLGVAHQGLGQYEEALIAFAGSLATDPKQTSTLIGLMDAMLKSPMKGTETERERERERETETEREREGGRLLGVCIVGSAHAV